MEVEAEAAECGGLDGSEAAAAADVEYIRGTNERTRDRDNDDANGQSPFIAILAGSSSTKPRPFSHSGKGHRNGDTKAVGLARVPEEGPRVLSQPPSGLTGLW